MTELTVYKLDENGREVWRYPARLVDSTPTMVKLEAAFNRDDMDLGYTTFARGDRFVEYFYSDRWYNIFAVYNGETDKLKGWYCNICRPALLSKTAVYCEDLTLDLWVEPDGRILVLDEVEFDNLALRPSDKLEGRQALQALQRLAALNQLPL